MNSFLQILFFLSLFLVTACSSSYVVSFSGEDKSVDEFNELAEGEEAEIILLDKSVITATEVYLSADSLHWFNPETKLKNSVAKSEISKVLFSDMWRGGLEGAGFGLLSGGGAGLLFGAATFSQNGLTEDPVAWDGAWALFGGACGTLIGFPIGLIIGHTNEYKFQNTEQQGNYNK